MSTARLAPILALTIAACAPLQPPETRTTPAPVTGPAPLRITEPAAAWPVLAAALDRHRQPVGDDDRATVVVVFASWCGQCHHALAELSRLRLQRGDGGFRVIGVNFRQHEEYDRRGNAAAVDAYVAEFAPWLQVVPAGAALFDALGGPTKIPSIFVYAADGRLIDRWDRRSRPPPVAAELAAALDRI